MNRSSCIAFELSRRRHLRNRKYVMYRNAVRGGPNHSHHQLASKNVKSSRVVFELCERTDSQTDRHTRRSTVTSSSTDWFRIRIVSVKNFCARHKFQRKMKSLIVLHVALVHRSVCTVMSMSVCLSVSLSFSSHNSKTARPNFSKIVVHVACDRGSFLL